MASRKIFSEEQIKEIVFLYVNTPYSTRDISAKFKVCYNTINGVLKKQNVTLDKSLKISVKKQGKPSSRKGQTHTLETKAKMSIDRKGIARTTGYRFTDEQKQKLRDAHERRRKKNPNWKEPSLKISKKAKKSKEEILTIKRQRVRYKNLIRRLLSLTGKRKEYKTEFYLGYSKVEFIAHIESKFVEGMSWDIKNSFQIDHIIPISVLLKYGITDPRIVNSLSNLQPLPPKENLLKSNRVDQKELESFLLLHGISQ